jgi:hypothetical protein
MHFLFWLYIVATLIIDSAPFSDSRFFNYVPFDMFIGLGSIAFVLSMIFMYMFLTRN